ncbi:hypothetical protein B7463_g4977, partial [Scytalidium lignicola]
MDIWMPNMDGYEAAEKILDIGRENGESTTVIAVTADITSQSAEKAREVGMHGFLAKPYKESSIMANTRQADFYAVLEISSTATQQQIRDAYKRAALKTHPDRVATDSPERASRTKKFQLVNDAYYTLSDPSRRREYDAQRKYYGFGSGASTASTTVDEEEEEIPAGSTAGGWGSFPWSAFGSTSQERTAEDKAKFEEEQFSDVFEEMLHEEGLAEESGRPTGKFWSLVGGLSGGAMGFILANFPGMLAGAVAGNRLGAVRDAKGKSVYAVFQELPQADKSRLLGQLAQRVFAHVASV